MGTRLGNNATNYLYNLTANQRVELIALLARLSPNNKTETQADLIRSAKVIIQGEPSKV